MAQPFFLHPPIQPQPKWFEQHQFIMIPLLIATPILAAAGWAFLVYLMGGGFGLAIAVFIILKLMGR